MAPWLPPLGIRLRLDVPVLTAPESALDELLAEALALMFLWNWVA